MLRDDDRRYWLTTIEAAKQIGTNIRGIRQLEGISLFPETIAGVERFRPSEVAAVRVSRAQTPKPKPASHRPVPPKPARLRRRTPGEEAAAVFALFDEHKDLREIVATLLVSPERVRTLYHHWLVDLDTGESLRQLCRRDPPAQPPQLPPAAAAAPDLSLLDALETRAIPAPEPSRDVAAASDAITALVEKLLAQR